RDITERKRAEESLERSREDSRRILETANDAFISMDHHGRICDWNSRAESMFGWPRGEAIGRPLAETIIPPGLRAPHRRGLARYLERGETGFMNQQVETHALHRDGREIPIELTLWVTHSAEGVPRFNAFARDISERVSAERALRDSEGRFHAIFEGSSLGIVIADARGRVLATNPTFRRILGYEADELVDKTYADLVHPDDATGDLDPYGSEQRYMRKDGRPVWLRMTTSLVHDDYGQLQFAVAMAEDLTERHLAESALREKAMQLVELVTSAASEASTAEEVFQICLDHICDRIGWPIGHVLWATEGVPVELVPTEVWHLESPEAFRDVKEST